MALADTKPIVFVAVGLFVGFLLGLVVTIAVQSEDTSESYADYRRRTQGAPSRDTQARQDPHGGAGDRAQLSFAKVHFMKKFVKALTSTPTNMAPNPDYEPLLADPQNPIVCADCHDPGELDLERMMEQDPGYEKVERFRRAPMFMIALMEAWVDRLNQRHRDRLKKPVTCTDCHAIDPRDMGELFRVYPPLMVSFVNALKQPPRNKNPAPGWKPLLEDPATASMLCSACHGERGVQLERALDAGRFDLSRPAKFADNKEFMIHLMEKWVERLNRDAKPLLTKAVVCVDCHDRDPRR